MSTKIQDVPTGGDLLFAEDGTVRLPLLTGVAIDMASRSHGCLTRQPTRERAEKVQAAVAETVTARGMRTEIRPSVKPLPCGHGDVETFGLYVVAHATGGDKAPAEQYRTGALAG